jgi:hypothetical protein
MIDPENVPEVAPDENLARYIFFHSHVRQDNSVKADAFMPPPDRELSVTRHLFALEQELWDVGQAVASASGRSLQGRADVGATICTVQSLAVRAAPAGGNPNHAHVLNWPSDKPAQKIIAQQIAAAAKYVARR